MIAKRGDVFLRNVNITTHLLALADVGGGADEKQVQKAFELLNSDEKVQAILVNILMLHRRLELRNRWSFVCRVRMLRKQNSLLRDAAFE